MRLQYLRYLVFLRRVGKFAIRIGVLCVLGFIFFILQHNGVVWFNMPSDKAYPIKGVDVSAHQGQIEWKILKEQGISFAFIKATEGSKWVDKRFAYNFENAHNQGLFVGAYHFFSFDSSGLTQAENFIRNVQNDKSPRSLPPVVDIEFYGTKASNPPSTQSVYKELDKLLLHLEQYYGVKPIIYTTPSFYDMYLRGRYKDNPLWIRSVFFAPHSLWARLFNVYFDKNSWVFWQYNPKGVLKGYSGAEKYIDLNVFNGGQIELEQWLKKNKE